MQSIDIIDKVHYFNTEMLEVKTTQVDILLPSEAQWLEGALMEEIDEFREACAADDPVGMVDALIDSLYFAIGGMVRMGLSADQIRECFNAVHRSNCRKKRGKKEGRENFGGDVADAFKPEGWVGPEEQIKIILGVN